MKDEQAIAIAYSMFDRFAQGEFLEDIEHEEGTLPRIAIWDLKERYPEVMARYLRSRELHAHSQMRIAHSIADTDQDSSRARNRMWIRQWSAERLARNDYGQKVDMTINNQVSISAALTEANERLRPISDLTVQAEALPLDTEYELVSTAADNKSDAVDIDPFS